MRRGRPRPAAAPPPPQQEQVVLHEGVTLVEVAEAWILDALMRDPTAGRMLAARVADRVAAVLPGQADALLARMRKLGHTPRVLEE